MRMQIKYKLSLHKPIRERQVFFFYGFPLMIMISNLLSSTVELCFYQLVSVLFGAMMLPKPEKKKTTGFKLHKICCASVS